jgi:uncharacterized protein YabN with tetrapyrrole methylase and pyrophosphatase domain
MKKVMILLATLAFSFGAVADTAGDNKAKAAQAINNAQTAQKNAKKVGFEWRDMGKMIKKAKAAQKAGKYVKAVKTANKVVRQGNQALIQAKLASTAGPRF